MALDRPPPFSELLLLLANEGGWTQWSDIAGFHDVSGSTLSGVLWSTTVKLLSWSGEAPHGLGGSESR